MKLPTLIRKPKKLQATATRRVAQPRAVEEEEEPTTNLSSALVVVLILHVVAIGGIYAFASVKTHQQAPAIQEAQPVASDPAAGVQKAVNRGDDATAGSDSRPAAVESQSAAPVVATAPDSGKSSEALHKQGSVAGPKDSGVIHTVVKGEIPERIAKKLGVSYNDLIKLNHIEDPTKIQIGQKLHVPLKAKVASN